MENEEVIKVNALDLKSFNENRFNPKAVYESDEIKVILAYFKQGQFIPVHTPGVDVVLYILDGEAQVVAGEKRLTAKKGDLIVVPKRVRRGIRALTELSVLHVVQPPPSEEDHKEVHTKIAQGRFD